MSFTKEELENYEKIYDEMFNDDSSESFEIITKEEFQINLNEKNIVKKTTNIKIIDKDQLQKLIIGYYKQFIPQINKETKKECLLYKDGKKLEKMRKKLLNLVDFTYGDGYYAVIEIRNNHISIFDLSYGVELNHVCLDKQIRLKAKIELILEEAKKDKSDLDFKKELIEIKVIAGLLILELYNKIMESGYVYTDTNDDRFYLLKKANLVN